MRGTGCERRRHRAGSSAGVYGHEADGAALQRDAPPQTEVRDGDDPATAGQVVRGDGAGGGECV